MPFPSSTLVAWVLLVLLPLHARASYPSYVIPLDDDSFEHDTQAASGQTTGHWFVLFTASTMKSHHQASQVWRELAADEDRDDIIYASVDLDNTKKTRELRYRFNNLQPPVAVLFRDRRMYVHDSSFYAEDAVEAAREFAAHAYAQTEPIEVPLTGAAPTLNPAAFKDSQSVDWNQILLGVTLLIGGAIIRTIAHFKKQAVDAARESAARKKALAEAQEKEATERQEKAAVEGDEAPALVALEGEGAADVDGGEEDGEGEAEKEAGEADDTEAKKDK